MTIKVYKPTNPLVKNHIECFYILEQTSEEKPATYLHFQVFIQLLVLVSKPKPWRQKTK